LTHSFGSPVIDVFSKDMSNQDLDLGFRILSGDFKSIRMTLVF